ncbi:MAG: hypothetical protein IJQ42_01475 [Oscillospiraceae bacterium]|jgi:hypothetical protein|nr:hypothetical protein [Oscillospiraceae bacterium]
MLGKLLKYEFRATGRSMLPVLGVLTLLVLLANISVRLLDRQAGAFLTILLIMVIFLTVIAVIVSELLPIIVMIQRFHKNLLAGEGYLMHTLPVSVHSLVWSKLIVSLVWMLLTNVIIFLLGGLSVMHLTNMNLGAVLEGFPSVEELRQFLSSVGLSMGDLYLFLGEMVVAVVLSGIVTCLQFYAAMSLGFSFTNHKGLMSVLCFVGILIVLNTLTNFLGVREVENLTEVTVDSFRGGMQVAQGTVGKALLYTVFQGALLYLATVLGLKKGLNLA